jgi:kinesin family member 5
MATVEDVIAGYNGTIFAYGQTGSGKTFTMMGPELGEPELWGIIPRAARAIFEYIQGDTKNAEFNIKCSYLEIYNEMVNDLLDPKKTNLGVRESPARGVYVDGLTEEFLASDQDVIDLINIGGANRAVSFTDMNAVSSRSHSLFQIILHQKSADGSTRSGRLNLVDLAGSEKVDKTGAKGQTLNEAKKINQSLSSLGNCIHALTEGKRGHIPYRDSKLTRILQESLGGNCKTTLLCAASPHQFNIEETITTLRFAQRAKTIKNVVKVNAQKSVAELNAIINRMKKELSAMKAYADGLEKTIEWMKGPEYVKGKDPPFAVGDKPDTMLGVDVASDKAKSSKGAGEKSGGKSDGSDGSAGGGGETKAGGNAEDGEGGEDDPEYVPPSLPPAGGAVPDAGALIEAQVELERLKGEHAAEIQDLKQELSEASESLNNAKEDAKKEAEVLLAQLKTVSGNVEGEREVWLTEKKRMEYEIEQHVVEAEGLTEEMVRLEEEVSSFREKAAAKEAELDQLRSEKAEALREVSHWKTLHEQIKGELAELEGRANIDQGEVDKLQAELQSFKDKAEELENENQDLHEYVAQLETDTAEAQDEVSDINAQMSLKEEQLNAVEAQMKAVRAQMTEAESGATALRSDMETMRARNAEELKSLKAELEALSGERKEALDKLRKLEAERSTFEEKASASRRTLEELQKTVESLERSNKELRSGTSSVDSNMTQLKEDYEGRLERTRAAHKEAEERWMTTLSQREDDFESQLKTAQSESSSLKHMLENELREAQAAVDSKKAELASALSMKESSDKEILRLEEELKAASTLRADLDRSNRELKRSETQIRSWEDKCSLAQGRVDAVTQELATLKAEKEQLEQELKAASKLDARASREVPSAEAVREVEELKARLTEAEEKSRIRGEDASKATGALEQVQSDLAKETARTKTANRKLEQQSTRLEALEKEISTLSADSQFSRQEVQAANERAEKAEAEMGALRAEIEKLKLMNSSYEMSSARRTRVFRPVTAMQYKTKLEEALATKEEFGQHKLKKTGSKWLDESRNASEKHM